MQQQEDVALWLSRDECAVSWERACCRGGQLVGGQLHGTATALSCWHFATIKSLFHICMEDMEPTDCMHRYQYSGPDNRGTQLIPATALTLCVFAYYDGTGCAKRNGPALTGTLGPYNKDLEAMHNYFIAALKSWHVCTTIAHMLQQYSTMRRNGFVQIKESI